MNEGGHQACLCLLGPKTLKLFYTNVKSGSGTRLYLCVLCIYVHSDYDVAMFLERMLEVVVVRKEVNLVPSAFCLFLYRGGDISLSRCQKRSKMP